MITACIVTDRPLLENAYWQKVTFMLTLIMRYGINCFYVRDILWAWVRISFVDTIFGIPARGPFLYSTV